MNYPTIDSETIRVLLNKKGLTRSTILAFQKLILGYYLEHGRSFPWRQTNNPYHILVSEFMLQQTQTSRVLHKYEAFITLFPDFKSLAGASVREILQAWQGLGYNRRALALQQTAQKVITEYGGKLPTSPEILITLPGIGKYTATAITVFAFDKPLAFIETNIRTVFLYFFFWRRKKVNDKDIMPLIETTIDGENPRQWYYALFDYGAMLKTFYKLNTKSIHYHKQSLFKGSHRELRGKIIRMLLVHQNLSKKNLSQQLGENYQEIDSAIAQLEREGFITVRDKSIAMN